MKTETAARFESLDHFRLEHGIQLVAPSHDHITKAFRSGVFYEWQMLEHIRKTYARGLRFIDVGAHVGGHTVFFAKACGAAHVLAFEPQPLLYQLLRRNLKLNEIGSCCATPICEAVGREHEYAVLGPLPEGNTGMARVTPTRDLPPDWRSIPGTDFYLQVMLDDYWEGSAFSAKQDVDVLKIDVEGMAVDVLLGGEGMIANNRPAIFAECQNERESKDVLDWARLHDYDHVATWNATPTYELRPL